ncbi:hypothetical protein [Thermococcus sp.]
MRYMSRSGRKAQTSLEALIIMGIIMFGAVVIVPNYISINTGASILSLVRSSAGIACSYLNMGVAVSGGGYNYSSLNALLGSGVKYNLYLNDVRYSEVNGTIYLTVNITNFGAISNVNAVEAGILNFIRAYLVTHSSARIVNGDIVYNGRKVIIGVEVTVE